MKRNLKVYFLCALALAALLLASLLLAIASVPEAEVATMLFMLTTVSTGCVALNLRDIVMHDSARWMEPIAGMATSLVAGIYTDLHPATSPALSSLFSTFSNIALVAVLVNGILLLMAYVGLEGGKESQKAHSS